MGTNGKKWEKRESDWSVRRPAASLVRRSLDKESRIGVAGLIKVLSEVCLVQSGITAAQLRHIVISWIDSSSDHAAQFVQNSHGVCGVCGVCGVNAIDSQQTRDSQNHARASVASWLSGRVCSMDAQLKHTLMLRASTP